MHEKNPPQVTPLSMPVHESEAFICRGVTTFFPLFLVEGMSGWRTSVHSTTRPSSLMWHVKNSIGNFYRPWTSHSLYLKWRGFPSRFLEKFSLFLFFTQQSSLNLYKRVCTQGGECWAVCLRAQTKCSNSPLVLPARSTGGSGKGGGEDPAKSAEQEEDRTRPQVLSGSGFCKWFNVRMGFGFISMTNSEGSPVDPPLDVFVHQVSWWKRTHKHRGIRVCVVVMWWALASSGFSFLWKKKKREKATNDWILFISSAKKMLLLPQIPSCCPRPPF